MAFKIHTDDDRKIAVTISDVGVKSLIRTHTGEFQKSKDMLKELMKQFADYPNDPALIDTLQEQMMIHTELYQDVLALNLITEI